MSRKVKRKRQELIFFCKNWEQAASISQDSSNMIYSRQKKRFLIFVNPFSGSGKGSKVWKQVEDILTEHLDIRVIETQRRLHALEEVRDTSLDAIDGIVTVSGDGLLWEVVNGFMNRKDWKDHAQRISFGVIPCGTGNGLSSCLGTFNCPLSAALVIVKGETRPLDLMKVVQDGKTLYGFLNILFGILSDVDAESERVRWMGDTRYVFGGAVAAFAFLKYNFKFAWLSSKESSIESYPECSDRLSECLTCQESKGQDLQDLPPEEEIYCDFTQPLPNGWKSLPEYGIALFALSNVKWAASDVASGPKAHLSDGYMDIVINDNVSKGECRKKLIPKLLEDPLTLQPSHPILTSFKTRAVALSPGRSVVNSQKEGREGNLMMDGEHLPLLPLFVTCIPSVLKVLAPGPRIPLDDLNSAEK